MLKVSVRVKLHLSRLLLNLAGLFLLAFGLVALAWVGWLTWHDVTMRGKDIARIFFGSRIGEAISLGIGMKVIHYFLIGLALLLSGLVTLLRGRIKAVRLHLISLLRAQPEKEKKEKTSGCPHHFGYLASRSKSASIPQECLICQKMLECRNKSGLA